MHMADALLSPAVGATLWGAAAATIAYSSSRVQKELDDRKIPLMGVLGAFIFATQMINFTIPGTGSSGHLGGGLLLAILLGPSAAFVAIASVLTVQALFFADGGLLALGCNIFNLGFFPCFVAYPLIYRPLAGNRPSAARIAVASVVAAVLGLQMGALGVVLQTTFSGISELPFWTFALLMQPIHLAIGVVEGLVTAAVVTAVWKARPELLGERVPARSMRPVLLGLGAAALLLGGILSWFASAHPDGLEWAIQKTTGEEEVAGRSTEVHSALAILQEKTAFLPDYAFPSPGAKEGAAGGPVDAGTTVSGVVGGLLTLVVAGLLGLILRRRARSARS